MKIVTKITGYKRDLVQKVGNWGSETIQHFRLTSGHIVFYQAFLKAIVTCRSFLAHLGGYAAYPTGNPK